jgi:polo-like kinase 1
VQDQNGGDTVIIEEKVTKTNGEIVIKKYSRGKALGRGGFAKCYEITNLETKKVLAAKIIPKSTLNRSRAKQKVTLSIIQLITEIKIHKSLNHNHIVKFEHVFEDH